MKILYEEEIKKMISEINKAVAADLRDLKKAENEEARLPRLEALYGKYSKVRVELHVPCGEIMNEGIRGFVWAWTMKDTIYTAPLTKEDRFSADGLEGKVVIPTNLFTALLACEHLPPHRKAIWILENENEGQIAKGEVRPLRR